MWKNAKWQWESSPLLNGSNRWPLPDPLQWFWGKKLANGQNIRPTQEKERWHLINWSFFFIFPQLPKSIWSIHPKFKTQFGMNNQSGTRAFLWRPPWFPNLLTWFWHQRQHLNLIELFFFLIHASEICGVHWLIARSQAGSLGQKLEVRARRAPRLLVILYWFWMGRVYHV